ncbi:MICOS complex subunit MIC60 [Selaginella moellendorffii]|uniref:MICOS complex subunit MIC60 n=1 Tax=Selaginella moellendorffii TaxID=88036 RepID=UPI000D1CD481|nr:MICOS complex subunit MIC60 [Selaginella moellendorffii]XP_024516783.1 MICOS complex subunit MIC60 [Selaginella moellendorffii]|eukprot:XP_024516782.1 MICOS complex subunit MIC60 [Selaginella moellendorffii]
MRLQGFLSEMIVSGRASHRISKRSLYAGLWKSFARINENESRRCFSSPAKAPTPDEAGQQKSEATNKATPAGSPKVQPAAGAPPKTSNPQQAVQKPPVKPAQVPVAGAAKPIVSAFKPQVAQAAGSASQKPQAPPSTVHKTQASPPPPGQKAQVSPGGGVKTVPPPVTRTVPPAGQKVSQATSSVSQKPSTWKVLMASGAVGSVVLGLFYWQFPRIHDGSTDAGDKGKDAGDAGFLPDQQNADEKSAAEVGSSVATDSGDTEKKEEEAVVNVVVEPDSITVETVPVESLASDHAEKDETETGKSNEVVEVIEAEVPSEEIVVEIEPDSHEDVSIIVSKSEDEEAQITVSDDNLVVKIREGNADISEPVLIQRGHEDLVQRHDKGNLVASDDSATPKSTGLDVVAAIHAAEQRQAEIDAMVFKEQLQFLQEKFQHELTDAERKASSYQEQIRRLREGMENQKLTHVSHLKKQQEEAESRFQEKMKLKDEETQRQLEEAELRAKAESAAAIIEERTSFLNDIGSVKVHMEAMNAALEAKSEEAREGHEIKQLSLGAFALEDALQNGAPIEKEVTSLLKSAGGDPLVEVAVMTLPKEVLEVGTLTPAELDRKLKDMEGALRELALMPPTGGGVLCHLIARLASALKLPDHALYLDSGVDAVLARVQAFVASGKLLDAAEVLSLGLSGTNADKLAGEWATQARNRAVAEQACALLRAHAAALALSESEQAS